MDPSEEVRDSDLNIEVLSPTSMDIGTNVEILNLASIDSNKCQDLEPNLNGLETRAWALMTQAQATEDSSTIPSPSPRFPSIGTEVLSPI